jgi:hypothetical protein
MLTEIHILLTYTCNNECDHCFLHCGPRASGTFTIDQISRVLDEASRIDTVEWIFFEGGEPFLFFPLMVEGIKRARRKGYHVGVVTNAYGATSQEDAALWLRPLSEAGISDLSISNDAFHYGEEEDNPARVASLVARKLGIATSSICIDKPTIAVQKSNGEQKGRPVVGGGPKFRGRAVETLTQGLPIRPCHELTVCPYEDLVSPSRVHVDPFGNVQLCQGLSMGTLWEVPLADLVGNYRAQKHPVCGPLVKGGPFQLAQELGVNPEEGYVDECHFCYAVRLALIDRFPQYLAPRQAYGL